MKQLFQQEQKVVFLILQSGHLSGPLTTEKPSTTPQTPVINPSIPEDRATILGGAKEETGQTG